MPGHRDQRQRRARRPRPRDAEYMARYQELNPDDPTILFNEAAVFLNKMDDDGARPLLEQCLEVDSGLSRVQLRVRHAAASHRRYGRGQKHISRSTSRSLPTGRWRRPPRRRSSTSERDANGEVTSVKTLCIGVAGGTGSGKTTVANEIVRRVGPDRIVTVNQDRYYHDLAHLDEQQRIAPQLRSPRRHRRGATGRAPRHSQSRQAGPLPVYDFTRHVRRGRNRGRSNRSR